MLVLKVKCRQSAVFMFFWGQALLQFGVIETFFVVEMREWPTGFSKHVIQTPCGLPSDCLRNKEISVLQEYRPGVRGQCQSAREHSPRLCRTQKYSDLLGYQVAWEIPLPS